MAVTKVAAFFRTPIEEAEERVSHTPEADLVTALMFLQKQVRGILRYSFISQLYVPFFLVHALPGRSLIICGIGNPTISIRHAIVPSLTHIREKIQGTEEIELVPHLLDELQGTFQDPPSEFITIRNAMLPTMMESLRQLVDSKIPEPVEEACIQSRLSTKDIHDVGILFRTERARLDSCLSEINQANDLIEEFVEEQYRILDMRGSQVPRAASLRWETQPVTQPPSPPILRDTQTSQLEAEKQVISQELMRILSRVEDSLVYSSEQVRRLINQIQAELSETERHLPEIKTRLTQLQNTANEFRNSLQHAISNVEESSSELEHAEQQWLLSRQHRVPQPLEPTAKPPFPTGTLEYSPATQKVSAEEFKQDFSPALRDSITKSHSAFKNILTKLKETIEQQHTRFEQISAPADRLQGYLPLMRLLVPIFIVKIEDGDGQYGVIPPVRITTPFSNIESNIETFDDIFSDQLQQLMRMEIRSDPSFRHRLDEQARERNWITRTYSTEQVKRGAQQLAEYGLLTPYQQRELTNFWKNIISQ